MKRVLGVLAAGVLAVAPLSMAMAEDHAATTETTAEAPAADAAMSVHELKLMDGTMVKVDGDMMAWVVDAEGKATAAPDGDHTLADGTVLTVKEGKVTAGMPAEAPAEGGAAEGAKE